MSDRAVYLQFIQGIITRLSGQSFQIKGWSITLVAAIVALSGTVKNDRICLIALLPAVIFWALDAYYTALERRFRHLFATAFGTPEGGCELSFDHRASADRAPIYRAAFSISVAAFYLPVVLCIFLGYELI